MGVRPVGQGSPKGRPRSGGRGNDFVGPQRSEGEAKWWDPAVLDARLYGHQNGTTVSQSPPPPESF